MAIANCPMCQSAIGESQTATCGSCGADLSRWLPKPPKLPPIETSQAPPEAPVSESNLGRGVLGAVAGAVVGTVVMYGFFLLVGFRFPLLGCGTGLLTGLGAKWLYKGTDNTLGMISAGIAMAAVLGTLYMMYGEFLILNLISVIVSASVAYRIASA
jgi:hypothetical protein